MCSMRLTSVGSGGYTPRAGVKADDTIGVVEGTIRAGEDGNPSRHTVCPWGAAFSITNEIGSRAVAYNIGGDIVLLGLRGAGGVVFTGGSQGAGGAPLALAWAWGVAVVLSNLRVGAIR